MAPIPRQLKSFLGRCLLLAGVALAGCSAADNSGLPAQPDGGARPDPDPIDIDRPPGLDAGPGQSGGPPPPPDDRVCKAPLSSCGTEDGSGSQSCVNLG